MEPARMLHNMCHNALSNVDINAIRKNRGFSAEETASLSLLENFYLTEIGVQAAMSSLTRNEIIALHLLKMQGNAVQVSFFEQLYTEDGVSAAPRYGYRTFSQRYQDVFKKVRTSLVRRGILIMAEVGTYRDESKMERWRFLLPKEFESFLPPLFPEATAFEQPGTVNQNVIRSALQDSAGNKDAKEMIRLSRGTLMIGNQEFRAGLLHEWLQSKWHKALNLPVRTTTFSDSTSMYISPVDAVYYLLEQLAPGKWIPPRVLALVLVIFNGESASYSGDPPGAAEICEAGWQWGQLARYSDGGTHYYRLAPNRSQAGADDEPITYLKTRDDGSVRISLRKISSGHLDLIARVSNLSAEDENLVAKPNLVKLGKVSAEVRNRQLIQWLGKNSPLYGKALSTVEKQWGKQIVHANLLVAKINDLSLKVAIEKAFAKSNEIQQLPNDYIAFPVEALAKVERAVKKAGHVVKTVSAEK